jgi:hypothetical protein
MPIVPYPSLAAKYRLPLEQGCVILAGIQRWADERHDPLNIGTHNGSSVSDPLGVNERQSCRTLE